MVKFSGMHHSGSMSKTIYTIIYLFRKQVSLIKLQEIISTVCIFVAATAAPILTVHYKLNYKSIDVEISNVLYKIRNHLLFKS